MLVNSIETLKEDPEEANAGEVTAEIQEKGAQDKFDAEIDNYLQKRAIMLANSIGTLEEDPKEENAGEITAEIHKKAAQDKFDAEIDNYLQKYVVKLKLNLSIQTETYNQAFTVNNLNTEKNKKDCMSRIVCRV
jgi:predicted RNA-binding protein Jag